MTRLPFRPTIRLWMAIVAMSAIPMSWQAWKLMQWRQFYLEMASNHGDKGKEELKKVAICEEVRGRGTDFDPRYLTAERLANRRLQYHEELRNKYARAAAHPWESVADDPPEPYDTTNPPRSLDTLAPLPHLNAGGMAHLALPVGEMPGPHPPGGDEDAAPKP